MDKAGVEIKTVIKQGHLKKLGGERKNWKERLVVLGERRIAYYDDTPADGKVLKGEFYIRKEAKVEELKDNKDGAGFKIFIDEGEEKKDDKDKKEERAYEFIMCDGEDNAAWIAAVQGVLDKIKALPESHYFIPDLQPTNAKVFGFNLPKGFPSFLVGMIPGSKPEDITVNNQIFRPEDLVEWVDDESMQGLFNPIKHVRVPEYKCREHPWGEGVSHYLKFDLLLSRYVKKATRYIRARMESTDGKIPEDVVVTSEDMNNLYGEISSEFAMADGQFKNHPKDAASAELGLDYLWDEAKLETPFEKKWRDWIVRYMTFIAITDPYKNNGIDYTILISLNFDNAFESFLKYKEENIKLVEGGASYQDLCNKKTRCFDILLPGITGWPDIINAYNNEVQALLPNMPYLMAKNFPNFVVGKDYAEKKDENLEVFNYFDLVIGRQQKFLEKLRPEVFDSFVKVTAPVCLKMQCKNFIDAFKAGESSLTQEEMKDLQDKMEAVAK